MSAVRSSGQVHQGQKIKLKPGRKPTKPATRKRGRPPKPVVTAVPVAASTPTKTSSKATATRPSRSTRTRPKLAPQGVRPKGLGIRRLPRPTPAEGAALGDTVPWIRGLLPRHHRSSAAVTSLAHHLRLLPQLGFDGQLSISIAYLSGAIGDAALRGTALAHAQGWDTLGDRVTLYAAVRWFVGRTCVVRARSVDSPTHAASLPRSRTAARLGFPNPRRGAAAADAAALADASSRTHRRRANARIDALCALVDMLCGQVDTNSPMVGERVLARFLRRAADFERAAALRSLALLSRRDLAAKSASRRAWGDIAAANREILVETFGVFGAMRRTRSLATLAAAAGQAAHLRRERIVDGLIGLVQADGTRLRAVHVRLSLAGTLHDAADADLPFTPRDGAKVLSRIAGDALKKLRCAAFGVADAHQSGHPHLHVVVVLARSDYVRFRRQLAEAYRRWGMTALTRGGRWVDRLVHVDPLDDPASGLWRYPITKLAPSRSTAVDMLADRGKVTPQVRLAAWRQAHGIRATWAKNIAHVAVARALPAVADGAHPLLDAARKASKGGRDFTAALLALGFAPKTVEPSQAVGARVIGSSLEFDETDEPVEIDIPGDHPVLAEVAAVPGVPTDRSDFAHVRVRLPNHLGHFVVASVERNPDDSLGSAIVVRDVRRRRPTKRREIRIRSTSGEIVAVPVEPSFVTVPVASDMPQSEVDADFQRIAARRAANLPQP